MQDCRIDRPNRPKIEFFTKPPGGTGLHAAAGFDVQVVVALGALVVVRAGAAVAGRVAVLAPIIGWVAWK